MSRPSTLRPTAPPPPAKSVEGSGRKDRTPRRAPGGPQDYDDIKRLKVWAAHFSYGSCRHRPGGAGRVGVRTH